MKSLFIATTVLLFASAVNAQQWQSQSQSGGGQMQQQQCQNGVCQGQSYSDQQVSQIQLRQSSQLQQQIIYITAAPPRPPTNTPMPSNTPRVLTNTQGNTQRLNITTPTALPTGQLKGTQTQSQQQNESFFGWIVNFFQNR